jgi:hypothetical protein
MSLPAELQAVSWGMGHERGYNHQGHPAPLLAQELGKFRLQGSRSVLLD